MRHLLVFFRADRPVEKSEGDARVRHGFHVGFLGVHQAGTENQFEVLIEFKKLLMQVDNGNFATAA